MTGFELEYVAQKCTQVLHKMPHDFIYSVQNQGMKQITTRHEPDLRTPYHILLLITPASRSRNFKRAGVSSSECPLLAFVMIDVQ
jgi:hypothetical protein